MLRVIVRNFLVFQIVPSVPAIDNQMEQSAQVEETSTTLADEAVVPMNQDALDNQYKAETLEQQRQQQELQPHVDNYADDGTYQNDQCKLWPRPVAPMTTAASTAAKAPRERWHWAYNRVVQVRVKSNHRFCFVETF